ncbi:DNA topoisomerase III [Salinispirillum sp. LH 10-3-1]|uniref:DNA topoisomerase n=1 Tax=Salinispirillum sp. LH 10-3-1 TaxID=2952525 RepID=A0AB38YBL0_9GAMM
MRLFIAEKPSLARAIADALPGTGKKEAGCIRFANGDVVSWCIGHLLEQADPDAYDPAFKQWRHDDLPIVPQQWRLVPRKQVGSQLSVLRKLVKEADQLVHAGDPDREGQLLVDEVLAFLKVPAAKKATTQRLLIADLNRAAVERSLRQLKPNADFQALSTSALARARADWLYGINLTRAMTLQGKVAGYQGVLSIGRVQTPVLGLVVERDDSIEAFVSQSYYDVIAWLETEQGESFSAKWIPSDACERWLDEQGRNLSYALAQNVVQRVSFQPARVTRLERKAINQPAPLPHSLSSLQMEANRAFGMSAQQVLDTAQSLYETHKAITYPRSDSRHLPVEHFAEAAAVTKAIETSLSNLNHSGFSDTGGRLNLKQKSKAWNDAKVGAHHAIIPTQRHLTRLNPNELKVYGLICRSYLAQFMPVWKKIDTQLDVTIAGGLFRASQTDTQDLGWKALFPSARRSEDAPVAQPLPILNGGLTDGQPLQSLQAECLEKHTTPPKPFTEATLLAAMTGISRFVSDASLKSILKETDGLGTEATRAGIIELLFKRGFLQRQGKNIHGTAAGRALIHALPARITQPDLTARWESVLGDIADRKARYEDLMQPLEQGLTELCNQLRTVVPKGLAGLGKRPGKSFGNKRTPRARSVRKKASIGVKV